MTGIAAASFFSNTCRFGGCGLPFPTLAELIEHIEDNHIGECPPGGRRRRDPRYSAGGRGCVECTGKGCGAAWAGGVREDGVRGLWDVGGACKGRGGCVRSA
uniref:C2H2-type domain-containing protein n=1 Tax=Sphenodon punctatus TaxID=8508 RepID=A0A8D0GB54_SPHPU